MDQLWLFNQLATIQSLDSVLARLRQRHSLLLRVLDRVRGLQQAAARERLRRLRTAQERISDLAWELEDIAVRLRELEQHQPNSGDLLLDREVSSLRRRHATVEESLLVQMLQADELHAGGPSAQQERFAQRLVGVEARIALANEQRRILAATLPPEALAAYEALRSTTDNLLTTVEDGGCVACGGAFAVPSAHEALATCPGCGRIVTTRA